MSCMQSSKVAVTSAKDCHGAKLALLSLDEPWSTQKRLRVGSDTRREAAGAHDSRRSMQGAVATNAETGLQVVTMSSSDNDADELLC